MPPATQDAVQRLVIDYMLTGPRPGYTFLPPTDAFSEETLRAIWRAAMPRGQGWGDPRWVGARSIKAFPLDDGRVALSEVTVTDREDEHGRRGIRRAEIAVLPAHACADHLRARLEAYPAEVRREAGHVLSLGRWVRILERAVPRPSRGGGAIVLAHPYQDAEGWRVIEFTILYLVTRWTLRALRGWPTVIPFTTLALDYRDESRVVALPLDRARELRPPALITIGRGG
ncbi:MAG: hypothetical protein Kow00124_26280 [Anaerolineae bacterium]